MPTLDVKARVALPIHYGLAEGFVADILRYKELLNGKLEVILKKK